MQLDAQENLLGRIGKHESSNVAQPLSNDPWINGAGEYMEGAIDSPRSYKEIERPPLRKVDKYLSPRCLCIKTVRFSLAFMICVGYMVSFGMHSNIGMAKLYFESQGNWSVTTDTTIDSAFFWGYLIALIPGGFLTSIFPANRIFGTAIATSAFLNLMLPGAIMVHPTIVIMLRFLQGLGEGATFPACYGVWRFWAPPMERSRLATMAFSGSYAGVLIGMLMSGVLSEILGWQASFYFYGVAGIIWSAFWLWLSFEKPRHHPTIMLKELNYIEESLGGSVHLARTPIPFGKILTSMPVYAIIVANFCRSWNFYLLVLYQSAYLKHVFDFQISETGFIGNLSYVIMTIILPCGGILADRLRKKGTLSTTMVRKIFNSVGFGMEAILFLVVAFAKTATVAIIALNLGIVFNGFAVSGYNVNHLDIAPRYASILMGVSKGIGTIAGIICPVVIDHLTEANSSECWTTVFIMAFVVHLIGITFYAICASGDLQSWAEPKEERYWARNDTQSPLQPVSTNTPSCS